VMRASIASAAVLLTRQGAASNFAAFVACTESVLRMK
jgi:hypothetical protein